jgi:hypothetical protein
MPTLSCTFLFLLSPFNIEHFSSDRSPHLNEWTAPSDNLTTRSTIIPSYTARFVYLPPHARLDRLYDDFAHPTLYFSPTVSFPGYVSPLLYGRSWRARFYADVPNVPSTAAALFSVACQKPIDFDVSTIQSQGSIVPPSVTITPIPSHYHSKDTQYTDAIVEWDGPEDPENPRNWNKRQRWIVTLVVSLFTFIRYVCCFYSGPCTL